MSGYDRGILFVLVEIRWEVDVSGCLPSNVGDADRLDCLSHVTIGEDANDVLKLELLHLEKQYGHDQYIIL